MASTHTAFSVSRLRQRTFPPRRHLSLPSTKSSLRHRQQTVQQSTLTQMNFVTSSFGESDSDASDFDGAQPRKRRKTMAGANSKQIEEAEAMKQTTLTQIGWPVEVEDSEGDYSGDDVEGEEEEKEDSGEDGEVEDRLVRFSMDEQVIREEGDAEDEENDELVKHESPQSRRPSPSYRPSPHQPCRFSPNDLQPSTRSPGGPVLKTPQRRQTRREIPSSQSSSETPLSASAKSPLKRTPLTEIPQNVWAQRDEEGRKTTSPSKAMQGKLQVQDSYSDDEQLADDDEVVEEDKENLDWSIRDSPSKKASSRSASSKPHAESPVKGRKKSAHGSSSPPQIRRPSDSETMPAPRSQPSTSPTRPTSRYPYNPLRSSQATTITTSPTQPSHPRTLTPRRLPKTRTRSSNEGASVQQAAIFQQSPRSQQLDEPRDWTEYDLRMPPTPPPVFESQFPYSAYSGFSSSQIGGGGDAELSEGTGGESDA